MASRTALPQGLAAIPLCDVCGTADGQAFLLMVSAGVAPQSSRYAILFGEGVVEDTGV